ncbi:MAG: bifunctional serine/threonine-protein kinase/formylglycine-generating enzyme family protein [Pseudomonadales bacterium]
MAIPGYRILRKIRQGGMSTVYLAVQRSIDREVAIKVMSPSLSSDPSFGSRFYREAKIVGQLSHPNIVSIYDVGSYKHYNYIAMDFLPGAPLQDRLVEGISGQEAVKIIREMASALDCAHRRGYIHRDIKPDNILFHADGSAVLCDFGIAKALKSNIKMTHVGAVLGTPHYMSPEQAQGKEIDGRADIYSLGVVFFEMLAGQVPFSGDEAIAVAVKHMTAAIPKLPAEHRAFQPIIDSMMDKKASSRLQTGKDIIEALNKLASNIQSGNHYLTPTRSTTVQILGLVGALFHTLTAAISLSIKRLMLTNIKFSSNTVQLSHEQLADIDSFILNSNNEDLDQEALDDLPLFQDTLEQPAIRYNFRWLYWPIGLACMLLAGFIYLDIEHPEKLRIVYTELTNPKSTPINADIAPPKKQVADASTYPVDLTFEERNPEQETPAEMSPTPTFALTINTVPADAAVRIVNTKPKYTPGIMLSAGAYHIVVSAKDYFPRRQWLRITGKSLTRTITLKPTRRLLAAGTPVVDKMANNSMGPTMIVLPQGAVTIEQSGNTLSLSSPLAISQYEITFKQYDQFAKDTGRRLPKDFGWGREKRPVIGVTYQNAKDYARWMSEQTQQTYRLPTQQEWEYAARGGQGTTYWWGNGSAKKMANCSKGCKSKFNKLFGSTTAPIGSYKANNYGLYDNAGNVAEWLDTCQEWTNSEKNHCKTALKAGGSHSDVARKIEPGSVEKVAANKSTKTTGLRLVLEL